METPTHYRWADVEEEQLNPLLKRQFVHGTQAMLTRFELAKGCIVPLHSHANEQITYIVTGSLEFDFSGVKHLVTAGELLVIPGGVPHSAITLEDTLAFDVFAPPRQDWIDKNDAYLR